MKFYLIVFSLFTALTCLGQKVTPLAIGEQIVFESEELNEERTLNIYLPHSYHPDSAQTYPVIYVLDGSMHEDMLHITGLVQFCSYSWINLIPECIVVGISNVNRYRDFTYYPEFQEYLEEDPRRGGSAAFIQFLEKEVQPLIEGKYKTNEHKALLGQSLGGLLATQILLDEPQMFNHYYIISPSLWYDNELLLSVDLPNLDNVKSVYIGVGKEGKTMQRVAKSLYKKLKPVFSKDQLAFGYFPEHDHGDVLHNAMYTAFETIGKMLKQTTK